MTHTMASCWAICLLLSLHAPAQGQAPRTAYPKGYFRSPVREAVRLSGTFGELRPNHFHAGIDIKGAVGQPLFAAAEGYIQLIKVSSDGYGKVLYLRHPNGYLTVYAHLDAFTEEVEELVRAYQYAQESFEVEIRPEAGRFPVAQGDSIGTMGLTGRSYGPHLHFEIRDAKTDRPINPLLFGDFGVKDKTSPNMYGLRLYEMDEAGNTCAERNIGLVPKGKGYGIKGDTLRTAARRLGLGLKVYDQADGVPNWNGIYSLEMLRDDSSFFYFDFEAFSFDETRYLNAHIDCEQQVRDNSFFNRCFILPGNALSIYRHNGQQGLLRTQPHRAQKIKMLAKDAQGNKVELVFWVRQQGTPPPCPTPFHNYRLLHQSANVIDDGNLRIHLPPGALYQDLPLRYIAAPDRSKGIFSTVHQIHRATTPLHRHFELAIRPTQSMSEAQQAKAFIAYCVSNSQEVINCGGEWKDGRLHATVRAFGDYCIMLDTEPPVIKAVNMPAKAKRGDTLAFTISDNYPSSSSEPTYRATIDGQWVLMRYDAKNARLSHTLDGTMPPGRHQLRLEVSDPLGNTAVFEQAFLLE